MVDSSKVGLRLKYLMKLPNIELYVIRLIRDGRAVALTYMDPENFADARNPSLRGGGAGDHRRAERLTMAQAAREWKRSNEEAVEATKKLREKSIHRMQIRRFM